MSDRYLIVGLGNPGRRYKKTRHNAGFMVIDQLKSLTSSLKTREHQSELIQGELDNHQVFLAKPLTFMNRSGQAVESLVSHYHISSSHLLVIYDDSDLPFGQIRLRGKGSSGGHNGLESIIDDLGTSVFPRLRIGIGSEKAKKNMIKFVLSKFDRKEKKELDDLLNTAANAVNSFIINGLEKTMNEFNTRPKAKSNQEVLT